MGLKDTQSIARVVVHPRDPNIVYVAAVGHLFGPNPERGLFKTTDGGKTWTNTKFIDEDTGFTDVVMRPGQSRTCSLRPPTSGAGRRWGFNGGGPGSGLWKTTDGGKNWTKLEAATACRPIMLGRIGLDICRSKPNVMYAQIEVGASGGTGAGVSADGTPTAPGQRGGAGGRGRRRRRGRRRLLPDADQERRLAVGRRRQDAGGS